MKIVRSPAQQQFLGPLMLFEVIEQAQLRPDVFIAQSPIEDSVSHFVTQTNEVQQLERLGQLQQVIDTEQQLPLTLYIKPEEDVEPLEFVFFEHALCARTVRKAQLSPSMLQALFLLSDALEAELLDEFNQPVQLAVKNRSWWQRMLDAMKPDPADESELER